MLERQIQYILSLVWFWVIFSSWGRPQSDRNEWGEGWEACQAVHQDGWLHPTLFKGDKKHSGYVYLFLIL